MKEDREADLERFYTKVGAATAGETELSCAAKTIVLFRVALESGAEGLGLMGALHLVSRLLTNSLGAADNFEDCSIDNILDEYDPNDATTH